MNDPALPDTSVERLARLGHELRTPLSALIGYAEAMRLQRFGAVNPPYDDHAGVIHAAALHLLALVDAMTGPDATGTGLGGCAAGPVEPAAVAHEVRRLMEPRALEERIVLKVHAADDLGPWPADRLALAQILINLIDNALRHTAGGGEVVVRLSRSRGHLVVTVADSGGASPPAGSGRGLRVVRAICALHGGDFRLWRRGERGARATARLALSDSG